MARHHSRIGYIAILAALVGSPALAEVKLPIPAVDQSAVAGPNKFLCLMQKAPARQLTNLKIFRPS
jgi:hypothetical protein